MGRQREVTLPDGARRVTWTMDAGLPGTAPYEIEIVIGPDGKVTVNGDAVSSPQDRMPAGKAPPSEGS